MSEAARKTESGVSNAAQQASVDQREASRFTLLIQPAKIIDGKRELPCVLRDLSEAGVSVRSFFPLPDKGELEIELLNGTRFAIEPVWNEERAAGFRFTEQINVAEILSAQSKYPKRPIRIRLGVPAVVVNGAQRIPIMLEDISQQGAKLTCGDELRIGSQLILRSDTIPRTECKVRWRRNEQYGLVFEQSLKLPELAELVAKVQGSFAFLKAD